MWKSSGEIASTVRSDPSNVPGVEAGHFGLQGISERVESLGGALTIDSRRDTGTRVSISITLSGIQPPSS